MVLFVKLIELVELGLISTWVVGAELEIELGSISFLLVICLWETCSLRFGLLIFRVGLNINFLYLLVTTLILGDNVVNRFLFDISILSRGGEMLGSVFGTLLCLSVMFGTLNSGFSHSGDVKRSIILSS